jgi:branched-subunit amino acid aminotransferase/4-amino-4-deoxychorismate lyase
MSAEPLAFLNSEFLPYSQAKLSLHDAGFVFGATVTDYCRTFSHKLFRWSDHLARFRRDCTICYIPLTFSDEQLTITAAELIEHNAKIVGSNRELALITFATPGEIGYFVGQPGAAGDSPPTVGMHTMPLSRKRYRGYFEHGIDLVAFTRDREITHLPRVKHRSRMHWWLAERWFKTYSECPAGAIAISEDPKVGLLDTAIGSILLIRNGHVLYPHKLSILDGITLRVIEEICENLEIPVESDHLTRQCYEMADEAILVGSAFGIAPVRSIQSNGFVKTFAPERPIFERLLKAFSDLVGVDIRADFLSNP